MKILKLLQDELKALKEVFVNFDRQETKLKKDIDKFDEEFNKKREELLNVKRGKKYKLL